MSDVTVFNISLRHLFCRVGKKWSKKTGPEK